GAVYMTVRDEDKPAILPVAVRLAKVGLRIYATRGTAQFLREHGVDAMTVYRISENLSPDALGLRRRGEIRLVINTPTNAAGARSDSWDPGSCSRDWLPSPWPSPAGKRASISSSSSPPSSGPALWHSSGSCSSSSDFS